MFALPKLVLMALLSFLRLAITNVKLSPPPNQMEQNGALVNNGALTTALGQFATNASPAFGNFNMTEVPSVPSGPATYPAQAMVGGFIRRVSAANATDSSDTAVNIVAAIPGAAPLQTFPIYIANMGSAILTLGANTGVTIVGTAAIARFSTRLFLGTILGSTSVQISNFANLGASGTTG